jgi:hypothetical protein
MGVLLEFRCAVCSFSWKVECKVSENTYKPRNYRLVRHVTKNRILDIQDALEIGKLRIEIVQFVEGEGAKLAIEHYAEPDALAVVCYDILQGRPWERYIEFKGTVQGEAVTSRVLVVERVEARNPVKITVSRGPGKVMGQGAIQPLGKPEVTLSMLLSEFDARRIAFTILRHIWAYEAANYHSRVIAGTRRPAEETAEVEAASPVEERAPEEVAALAAEDPAPQASAPEPPAASPPRPPRRAPAVETYWMAAERLGLSRPEAENLLQRVEGDWGRAWKALRSLEGESSRTSTLPRCARKV